jgi:hypothetical protein
VAYTTSFLTVNGLDVPVTATGQRRGDSDKWGRGNGTVFSGTTFARKRQFSVETPPLLSLEAHALSGWMRGLGHHFSFEWYDPHLATTRFHLYSTDGGAVFSGGSAATTSTKWGSYSLLVAGNDVHTTTALFGSEGPNGFSVWRNQISANTWELCSAAYDGSTTRFFAGPGGTTITTSFGWAVFASTRGYTRLGLEGQTGGGSSSTCLYDGVMLLPYSPTSAQLYARHERLNSEPGFPLVAVGGHGTRSLPEIACKGAVSSYPVHRVVLNGGWRDNARRVVGSLMESHELTAETVLPTEPVLTIEDLILADPDLFLYYPLDDASNPGTVADLGPGGYDLTVYDPDGVFTWGTAGPNTSIPAWPTANFDISDTYYGNYLARAESAGPIFPAGSVTLSFAIKGAPAYGTELNPFFLYGWSGGAGGAVGGIRAAYFPSSGSLTCYVGNVNHNFTGVPALTTARLLTFTLDLSVGTYGTLSMFVDGVLHAAWPLSGAYSPPNQARPLGILLFQSTSYTYECPPSVTNYAYSLDGSMAHWFLSARAWSMGEVLALAQAAGFA